MRRSLLFLHRWAGLTIALALIVTGLTGVILPFQRELAYSLAPDVRQVERPGDDARPLAGDELARRVEAETGGLVGYIPLHLDQGRTPAIFVGPRLGGPPRAFDEVFADPYTGAIRAKVRYADLLGVAGLVWVLVSLIGLALNFSGRTNDWRATLRWWTSVATIRRKRGSTVFVHDLQFVTGAALPIRALMPLMLSTATAAMAQDPVEESAAAQAAPSDPTGEKASIDPATIVVTGAAVPVEREKIGNSLTVIEGETIETQKQAYLLDVLRRVPGVSVNQTGSFGGQTQIRIRGSEANHVLVLIDGIEVMTESSGEVDFSSLLANNIDRVEVLRGPQSGLYGSNALAGVINVITKGGDGPAFDAEAEYGSFDTKFARAAVTAGNRETFLTGSVNYRETDGISTAANGTEPDGDRNFTGYLKGGAALGSIARIDASLHYVDKHSDTDGFDFSGGPDQGLAIDDDSYSNTRDWSGGVAVTVTPVERWQTVASVAFHDGESVGGSGGADNYGDKGDRLKLAARSSYGFDTGDATHTLTAFVEHEEEGYRNTFPTDPSQDARLERDMLGFGAEYRLDLFDRVFLRGAVRHDDNEAFDDVTTFSVAGAFVIGSGTRLHASYGTGVTNPTFFEQFGFVPGDFVGNPELLPEKAKGFDIGIEQRFLSDKALVDVTYFNSKLENEIVSIFPSVENDIGESDREGVEVTARLNLGAISFGGSYTYTDADDPDGAPEVRRPRHQASADITGRFGPQDRASFSAGLIYNGRMLDDDYRDYFNNGFVAVKSLLEAFTVVRLAAAYRVTDEIEVFARIENALDEDYEQNLSYGTLGRAVYGGVRVVIP